MKIGLGEGSPAPCAARMNSGVNTCCMRSISPSTEASSYSIRERLSLLPASSRAEFVFRPANVRVGLGQRKVQVDLLSDREGSFIL